MKKCSIAKLAKKLGQKIACRKKVSKKKGNKIARRMLRSIVAMLVVGESVGISSTRKGERYVTIIYRSSKRSLVIALDTREKIEPVPTFHGARWRDQGDDIL